MGILFFLGRLVRRKQTFPRLDADDVRRERIRLEQHEAGLVRDIETLERQKEAFFRKGVAGGSDRQKLQIARKIKELDVVVCDKDQQLSLISRNLRVLNGIAQIKDKRAMLETLGLSKILANMNIEQVQKYVEQATIEGHFQMERFTKLLETVESGTGDYLISNEDSDTRSILAAMHAASEVATEAAISNGLSEVERTLRKNGVDRDKQPSTSEADLSRKDWT